MIDDAARLRIQVRGARFHPTRSFSQRGDLRLRQVVLLSELSQALVGLVERAFGGVQLLGRGGVLLLGRRGIGDQRLAPRLGPGHGRIDRAGVRCDAGHAAGDSLHLAGGFFVLGILAGRFAGGSPRLAGHGARVFVGRAGSIDEARCIGGNLAGLLFGDGQRVAPLCGDLAPRVDVALRRGERFSGGVDLRLRQLQVAAHEAGVVRDHRGARARVGAFFAHALQLCRERQRGRVGDRVGGDRRAFRVDGRNRHDRDDGWRRLGRGRGSGGQACGRVGGGGQFALLAGSWCLLRSFRQRIRRFVGLRFRVARGALDLRLRPPRRDPPAARRRQPVRL